LAGVRGVEPAERRGVLSSGEGLLLPESPGQSGILEYDIDTARAIDSLLWNGTLSKFPNVRHIFSHSGGAFTVLAARIMDDFPKNRADKAPNGVEYEIKKLYFDTAHASKAPALDALKDIVPVSQIMYGSDAPIRNYDLTDPGLDVYPGFRRAIGRRLIGATPNACSRG